MGVSVSLVELVSALITVVGESVFLAQLVSALTTVSGCVCVSGAKCQCIDHCGWVCLYF